MSHPLLKDTIILSCDLFYALFDRGEKREYRKWGKEKGENVIFIIWFEYIRRGKKMGVGEIFHLYPPFISLPHWKEKMKEISIERKVQNYPHFSII